MLLFSKQSSFDLVAVDGPACVRLFFTPVELDIRTGTNLFDELAKSEWLLAVSCPLGRLPTWNVVTTKRQMSSNPEEEEFLCGVPDYVVATARSSRKRERCEPDAPHNFPTPRCR